MYSTSPSKYILSYYIQLLYSTKPLRPRGQSRIVSLLFGQELLERGLVNHHVPNGPQSLPTLLLPLKKFLPSRDVGRMQLGQDILAEWLECLACNDLPAYCRLNDNLCFGHCQSLFFFFLDSKGRR